MEPESSENVVIVQVVPLGHSLDLFQRERYWCFIQYLYQKIYLFIFFVKKFE